MSHGVKRPAVGDAPDDAASTARAALRDAGIPLESEAARFVFSLDADFQLALAPGGDVSPFDLLGGASREAQASWASERWAMARFDRRATAAVAAVAAASRDRQLAIQAAKAWAAQPLAA